MATIIPTFKLFAKDMREYFDKRRLTLNNRIRFLVEYTIKKGISSYAKDYAAGRIYSIKLQLEHMRNLLDAQPTLCFNTLDKGGYMITVFAKPGLSIKDLREHYDKRIKVLNGHIRLIDNYTDEKNTSDHAKAFAAGRMCSMKIELAHIKAFLELHTVLKVHAKNK
jgi:hypothetical protein